MECQEFLEGYSEYLDGRLGERTWATFEAHREACERCERYDRVIQRGVSVWRSLPEVEPSPDFLPRLQHRLYHVDDAASLAAERPLGSAALVAVAAVGFLALAWLPFATQMSVEVQLPAVDVEGPPAATAMRGSASLFGRGPFLAPEVPPPPPYARPALATEALFDPYVVHAVRRGTVTPVASGDIR